MVINSRVNYMLLPFEFQLHNSVQKLTLPCQSIFQLNFFVTFLNDSATPRARVFFDLVILQKFCRVNMYIQGCGQMCGVFLLQLLCSRRLYNIKHFHTSHGFLGF